MIALAVSWHSQGKSPKASEFDMVDDPQPPTEPSPIPSVPSDEKGTSMAGFRDARTELSWENRFVVLCGREGYQGVCQLPESWRKTEVWKVFESRVL